MLGGVGCILELLQDDAARDAVAQLLCCLDGSGHTVFSTCQPDLGTVGLHEVATFDTHRLRHRQNQFVALDGTDECQPYASVAAGRLDDGGTGFEQALLLGVFYHR